MTRLDEILKHNTQFVGAREYEAFRTDRFPNKKLVILTCMDTRLVELLPKAMGVSNGDAKIVKTAGAVVSHPFGSITRSLLIAVYELGATEICVVGHDDCGMTGMHQGRILDKARQRGIPECTLRTLQHAGIDLGQWLAGFENVQSSVRHSVELIRNHPLLPADVAVHGLLIHSETGQLQLLDSGYAKTSIA